MSREQLNIYSDMYVSVNVEIFVYIYTSWDFNLVI